MTKFNPENKATLTYGECLDPAMKITDTKDAQQYVISSVCVICKRNAELVGEEMCRDCWSDIHGM